MKSRQAKIIGWIIGGMLVLGLWVLFGPAKLGGSSTYSITSGISMEPLLHKNNLALVRAQPSYRVGDVVLYQSSTLHKPVLHRIILIQNGNYFFKGDNNSFVDPGHATRSELIGKLWLHVPVLGGVLGWTGKPVHASLLAGLIVVLFTVTGFTTMKRRRYRPGKSPSRRIKPRQPLQQKVTVSSVHSAAAQPSPAAHSSKLTTPRQIPSYFEGPAVTLMALGVLLALALLCFIVGFSRPAWHLAPLPDAYKQSGVFEYMGLVKTPSIVYPSGSAKTGDPIFSNLIDTVTINFKYRFASDLPHKIKGTIELKALVLSKSDTWKDVTVLAPVKPFSGDDTTITTQAPINGLYELINSVSEQSGSSALDYSADIDPVVHITGTVGGKPIDDKFEPVLPFTVGKSVIKLSDTTTPAPAGATYVPPSADTTRAATLNPSKTGSVPHLTANTLAVARHQLKIPALRYLSVVFCVLAAGVAVLHDILRRRQTVRSDDELIADQFQDLIIPVDSLETPAGTNVVEVPTFTSLAELAQYLERPILHSTEGKKQLYAVDDGTARYVVHESPIATAHAISAKSVSHRLPAASSIYRRAWGSKLVRVIALLVLLAVIATIATSSTAGNTVPASKVGRSVNARTVPQVTPTGCNTLTLTSIVFKAAGSSSNTTSNALIIGTSGVETLNDTGNNNCIVGGAGKDNITARATSICIVGPTTGATYTTCTKK